VVKVAEILASKASGVITIRPTDTIATLAQRLREKRIGAAVVSSDGHAIEGVISERDIAYGLAVHQAELHALPVSALMTKAVITCSLDDDIGRVASAMRSRNIRHLPVEEGGRVVGMVSIRDVLNSRVDELQHHTAMLSTYGKTSGDVQDRE
jgi:CBS domain-containing protein